MALNLMGLKGRVATLEAQLRSGPPVGGSAPLSAGSSMRGKRIRLDIRQDDALGELSRNLEREFLARGARLAEAEGDAYVSGKVVCNGYPNIYFEAELSVRCGPWPDDALVSRPVQGRRQANLVLHVLKTLEDRFETLERHSALEELGGP